MKEPQFDIGWHKDYKPPHKQHRLFSIHCDDCAAGDICGERHTESACGDPSEYRSDEFHPATTKKQSLLKELLLPFPKNDWESVSLPSAFVIAKNARPAKEESFALSDSVVFRLARREAAGRVAVLVGRDDWIFKLWRRRGRLGSDLRDIGFGSVVAPAYSTYWNSSPLEGLVSMRLTASVALALNRHIRVIPTICWRNGLDLKRWSRWLEAGNISTFAVHLGTRERRAWDWHLEGIGILRDLLPSSEMRLVVIGPSTKSRIQSLLEAWEGQLTIGSHRPWQLAQHGLSMNHDLRPEKDFSRTVGQLARENAEVFIDTVNAMQEDSMLRVAGL